MPSDDAERFDAIILGTGQGGKPLALALARAGWRTAVVERGPVGGTCVNVGCTPTKTLVASARVAHLARRVADYGVQAGPVRVDLSKVLQPKRAIVESFRPGGQKKLETPPHIALIFGEGCFTAPHEVEVSLNAGGTRRLTADKVFINT